MDRRSFLRLSAISVGGMILASGIKESAAAAIRSTQALTTATYRESPLLSEKVQAGVLPPVEQRLPMKPLVLTPLEGTGKYGGRLRNIGSWVGYPFEMQYGHSPLRWINDGLAVAPGTCDTWETNATNTVWTFHLREGLKWSDGEPCTVDDILFWWQDLVQANTPGALDPTPDFGATGGQLARFDKVNETTLQITYAEPAPLTAKRLACWVNGRIGTRFIAPKHYLTQFHPSYNPAMLDFEVLAEKIDAFINPELPTLNAWIIESTVEDVSTTYQRNPYYYAVDPEGNQLPYIDGLDYKFVFGWENQLAEVTGGNVDFLEFHDFTLHNLPELRAGETAGNYNIRLWDSGSGTGMMYFWNYDVRDDRLRALYRNPKFKKALSYALNRPLIQHTVYGDTGMQTTGTLSPKATEFTFNTQARQNFIKYRDAYVAYDPNAASALLDEIGLVMGTDGLRTYADETPFQLEIDLQADAGKECLDVLEIAEASWRAVGIDVVIKQVPPEEFPDLWHGGHLGFRTAWEASDGPDHLLLPSWLVPNENTRWAPLCGQILALEGIADDPGSCAINPWDRNPPRFCETDPQYADSPVETLHNLYRDARIQQDAALRRELVWEMLEIHYNNVFFLGTVADSPHIVVVSKSLNNVPTREQLMLGGFVRPWIVPSPALTNPETYSFGIDRPVPANTLSGGPGSVFTIHGGDFQPDSPAQVTVNDHPVGTVMTSPSGGVLFALDSSQAEPGRYIVVVIQVSPEVQLGAASLGTVSITTVIDIAPNLPVRPPDAEVEALPIPPDTAIYQLFLGLSRR